MKAVLLLAPLLLVGCSRMLDEPRQYYWNQEWQQVKELFTPPQQWVPQVNQPRMGPQSSIQQPNTSACTRARLTGRQIDTLGVSDRVAYQQCLNTPYTVGQNAHGQRLQGRP